MSTSPGTVTETTGELRAKHRLVIIASSLGTVFEWYDFYLYAVLALFFSSLFFPSGNPVASNLAALATFGAGFGVRPFGALVFGWVGDVVGRKYTFLITIVVMGLSTALVGLLPTYAPAGGWPGIGIWAPVLLVALRLAQGLALGGEYGGAATYVAEHAPKGKRGLFTSWIQTTATVGFFLALIVILVLRKSLSEADFKAWGWRIPFLLSVILLGISVYIRLKLQESPIFAEIKAQKKTSKFPLWDSFFKAPNAGYVWLALLGATAGQGVVWYTGQFEALFFLTGPLKLSFDLTYYLIGVSLLAAFPLFVFFGWLSDRIGRKPIMLGGCLLAAVTYIPLFQGLTHCVNPALEDAQKKYPVVLYTNEFSGGLGDKIWSTVQDAFQQYHPTGDAASSANVRQFLYKRGVPFAVHPVEADGQATLKVGDNSTPVLDVNDADKEAAAKKVAAATKTYEGLVQAYPKAADPAAVNWIGAELILIVFIVYVTMVYGPIAAFLVELFPTRVRYTSMSFPYHIGNGWFGGFLPLIVTAIIAATGDIYLGFWYPIAVALMTLVIGGLFIRETKDRDIRSETAGAEKAVGDGRDPALA
ncbi:MAG: MHS family MFS transporter [Verrucomicrobia bacterium]|nr:MHS family MFS transporter [Verrucomicrobiota bacterium]